MREERDEARFENTSRLQRTQIAITLKCLFQDISTCFQGKKFSESHTLDENKFLLKKLSRQKKKNEGYKRIFRKI